MSLYNFFFDFAKALSSSATWDGFNFVFKNGAQCGAYLIGAMVNSYLLRFRRQNFASYIFQVLPSSIIAELNENKKKKFENMKQLPFLTSWKVSCSSYNAAIYSYYARIPHDFIGYSGSLDRVGSHRLEIHCSE